MGDPSRPAEPPPTENAPHYYRLGDAARIVGVAPSAVRYWQAEFAAFVRPVRTKAGQHVFSRRDVRALGLIRHLLHAEGLSAREARERLPDLMASEDAMADGPSDGEQGVLALDLAAVPAGIAAAGPTQAEVADLKTRVEAAERELATLRTRLEAVVRERDEALSRAADASRACRVAETGLASARDRLDEMRQALLELVDAARTDVD